MVVRRTPGQRAGLSRERVLAAALEVLTERGFPALTMRAVADRLGVAPNAIYSHVADKTDLLDAVLDEVLAAVDGTAGLHRLMASTYDVLLAHPDLVPHYLARQGARGPQAEHLGDVMLEALAGAGVTGDAAREALRVLIIYTIGFAAYTVPLADAADLRRNFDTGLRWLLTGIGIGIEEDRKWPHGVVASGP